MLQPDSQSVAQARAIRETRGRRWVSDEQEVVKDVVTALALS